MIDGIRYLLVPSVVFHLPLPQRSNYLLVRRASTTIIQGIFKEFVVAQKTQDFLKESVGVIGHQPF
jgi:hypothetical protein